MSAADPLSAIPERLVSTVVQFCQENIQFKTHITIEGNITVVVDDQAILLTLDEKLLPDDLDLCGGIVGGSEKLPTLPKQYVPVTPSPPPPIANNHSVIASQLMGTMVPWQPFNYKRHDGYNTVLEDCGKDYKCVDKVDSTADSRSPSTTTASLHNNNNNNRKEQLKRNNNAWANQNQAVFHHTNHLNNQQLPQHPQHPQPQSSLVSTRTSSAYQKKTLAQILDTLIDQDYESNEADSRDLQEVAPPELPTPEPEELSQPPSLEPMPMIEIATKFACRYCSQEYSTRLLLKEHMRLHTECAICGKAYRSLKFLRKHMALHPQMKRHTCEVCGEVFTGLQALIEHKKVHLVGKPVGWPVSKEVNNWKAPPLTAPDLSAVGKGLHCCETCGKGFANKHALEVHCRFRHTNERPFECAECKKRFVTKHDMKAHERIHTGERPYKCQFCGKRLISSSALSKHLRVHKGLKADPKQRKAVLDRSRPLVDRKLPLAHLGTKI